MRSVTSGVLAAFLAMASGAGAAAATVGTLTFDDNAWADGVNVTSGVGTGNPAAAADGDTATIFNLRNDSAGNAVIEILFTDNLLKNGPGDDLVLFYGSNNNALGVTINGILDTSSGKPFEFVPDGGVGNNSGFSILGTSFDLDDFGIAADATLSSGIFVQMAGIFGNVHDVAALNSTTVPGSAVVPLPATAWLLIGGFAALGAASRRRK
jgi:hypothetical protein